MTYQFNDDLSLTLAGTYTHAEYKDFPDAFGRIFDYTTNSFVSVQRDLSGKPVERTPKFAGSAAVNYGFDLGEGRMALNANLFYTGSYYFNPIRTLKNDEHALLNLRATWTNAEDNLDISVYGTNVTNTKYFVSNFNDPTSSRARYGEPAMVGGSVTFRY